MKSHFAVTTLLALSANGIKLRSRQEYEKLPYLPLEAADKLINAFGDAASYALSERHPSEMVS